MQREAVLHESYNQEFIVAYDEDVAVTIEIEDLINYDLNSMRSP